MQHPGIGRIRQLVRSLHYVVSIHAAEELGDDDPSIRDRENIVLTGQIIQRQRDRQSREVKCVVRGLTLDGAPAETVVKIGYGSKLFFVTAYAI